MNCMICGAPLTPSDFCSNCGYNVSAQKLAARLSNRFYNEGLEKAQIRDLSGAIDCLKRSLKLNKLNIPARNLLGLVYFETGEVVAALSEWVISKNILGDGNPASDYIQKLQANANRLDMINQTIKKYNQCLTYCRQGNEDMAIIQLKKVLSQNPKLIKGYHLLALLYIRERSYEKARKLLKSAARIDKTNTTTLRFLREVDEQTGKMTSLEPRFRSKAKQQADQGQKAVFYSGSDLVIQPPAFRESSTIATLLNLGFGLIVGAAALWFLIVPAKTQKINGEANQKIVEYSDKVATQAAEINRMESNMKASEETVNSANEQIAQAEEKSLSYENLMKAYTAIRDESYTTAANAMQSVNPDLLSVDAKSMYDTVYREVKTTMFKKCLKDGQDAYDAKDYPNAIENLLKAVDIQPEDYDALYYLAHSYFESGDTGNADIYFQKIIDTNPGTRRASDAKDYMSGNPVSANSVSSNSVSGNGTASGNTVSNGSALAGIGAVENGEQGEEGEEDTPEESQDDPEDTQ